MSESLLPPPEEPVPPDQPSDDKADSGEPEARLDEQEAESFPASDPHSDWAGPPG